MKKVFFLLAVTIFSAVFISSCKKGEDDPFISFRSRDSRIIGTWVLKNKTYTSINHDITNTKNSVNSETSVSDEKTTTTKTFDGTTYTEKSTNDNKYNNTTISYQFSSNSFVSSASESKYVDITTDIYTYSVEIEIKDDHTYLATYTKTDKEHKTSNSQTYSGTTTTQETDTLYSPQNTRTWTEEGNWYWLDGNDDKIYINAGPLSGVLKRLSNGEVVIETIDNNTNNSTDYSKSELYSYNDTSNPYKTEEGTETQTKTSTNEDSDLSTWEAK